MFPKYIIQILSVFLFICLACFLDPSMAFAQETTKQRTTGTYLPVMAGVKTEKSITTDLGGDMALNDGSLKLIVPANFYDKNLRFGLRRVKWDGNSAVPSLKIDKENFLGPDIFEITAVEDKSGKPVLSFNQELTVVFRYYDEDATNFEEKTITVRFFDRLNQKWQEIPPQKDLNSNTLTIQTNHLTLFAVTGQTKVEEKKSIFNFNTNSDDTQPITGLPLWQKILLVLGIIILLGFGGWYGYNSYLEAKQEIQLEEDISVFGSENSLPILNSDKKPELSDLSSDENFSPNSAPKKDSSKISDEPIQNKSSQEKKDEIWINWD